MPIYEFKCSQCDHVFEELVSNSKERKFDCPKCSSSETRKMMSMVGGISMGGSKDPSSSCTSAPMCPSAAGGCCGGSCMH